MIYLELEYEPDPTSSPIAPYLVDLYPEPGI